MDEADLNAKLARFVGNTHARGPKERRAFDCKRRRGVSYGAFESRIQWDLQENLAIKSLFDIKLKSEGDILSLLRSMRQKSSKYKCV